MTSPRLLRVLIALPFLLVGGLCLFAPGGVERLVITPAYQHNSVTTHILIGLFGSQSILVGMFVALSRFSRTTFIAYGIAILPFLLFNCYFSLVIPVFNTWMAVDFAGNLMMLGLCIWGARLAER